MRRLSSSSKRLGARRGFTLIELIGVLAIMAIIAATVAPNALRSIEDVAIKAEAGAVNRVGAEVQDYLRANRVVPTNANWTTALAAYSSLAPADLLTNRRGNNRVYIVDPAVPSTRILLLSSMRPGLALPTAANVNAAGFQQIWQTADRSVPPTTSWAGWSAWNAVTRAGDYLIVERINLASIYGSDLLTQTLTLNNRGASSVSYQVTLANGTRQAVVTIAVGATPVRVTLYPRDRIDLYTPASATNPNYSYVVSNSGKTFDYNGTNWIPQ